MELNVTNTKRKCKLKFELGDMLAAAPPADGSKSERVSSADIKPHLSGRRRNSVSHKRGRGIKGGPGKIVEYG